MQSRQPGKSPNEGVLRGGVPAFTSLIVVFVLFLLGPHATGKTRDRALSPYAACAPKSQGELDTPELHPGKAIERQMAGGQKQAYRVPMLENQYAGITVDQRGIDVRVRLYGVDGKVIADIDGESRNHGREKCEFVAEKSGNYTVEIEATLRGASAAAYAISLDDRHVATERDRYLNEAAKRSQEAAELSRGKQFDAAIARAGEALNLVERADGSENAEYASSLDLLANVYVAKRDYGNAEKLFVRALDIRERVIGVDHPGADHPDVARSLHSLARLYREKGDAGKAKSYLERALGIRERSLDSNHILTATALIDYGGILFDGQEYSKAEEVYRRAVSIMEKSLGDGNGEYSRALHRLGNLYDTTGDFVRAEQVYRLELASTEKSDGKDGLGVAFVLDYLARIYYRRGEFDLAESLYRRTLDIRQKFNSENGALASLGNLALIQYARGDYQRSEELYLQVLERREKAKTRSPTWVGRALLNLGGINNAKGDFASAERYFKRALTVDAEISSEDARLRLLADILVNLSEAYLGKGDFPEAEESGRRALEIQEKMNGPNHPSVAEALNRLGRIIDLKGDSSGAEPLLLRSLAIYEKSEGPDSPDSQETLDNLAELYTERGDPDHAFVFQSRANTVGERRVELALATGSEQQKLAYLASSASEMNRTVTYSVRHAPNDLKSAEAAAMTVLRFKGRVLDAMNGTVAALRRRAGQDDLELLGQLNNTATQLSYRVLSSSGEVVSAQSQAEIKVLEQRKAELEDQMSRRSAQFRAATTTVTLDSIQKRIPDKAALIEFATYRPLDPTSSNERLTPGPPRYVVYVVTQHGPVEWRDLGPTSELDAGVGSLRQALRDPQRKDVQELARAVDQRVLQPIRALLRGTNQLLISPDGELNLIPFEALVDDERRYLIERYSISYLTSGRDLLRMGLARDSANPPLVIGAPTFGEPEKAGPEEADSRSAKRSGRKSRQSIITGNDLSNVYFAPLASTAQEAREVQSLLPDGILLTGAQASKSELERVQAPRILHIATHGFFLQDATADSSQPTAGVGGTRAISARIRSGNPLLRSGLALAGANLMSSGGDNGILTALEASGLNLWGTRLVTLSACDTGVGEVRTGEGVYGLRRAFVLAGAESLLMSLWPVSDYGTKRIMTEYYTGLKEGLGRGEALRQVKLAMLKRKSLQHPFYWAGFIQSGEWTSLDGKR
ncbi:MAG TPA: CHAT domain-containing tetratricopeptide repeat protein [Blastocatellia bacterium]|nr:CHAT domain-containing tetratricopeptide repeat protein [Blastocatellia bacterium]